MIVMSAFSEEIKSHTQTAYWKYLLNKWTLSFEEPYTLLTPNTIHTTLSIALDSSVYVVISSALSSSTPSTKIILDLLMVPFLLVLILIGDCVYSLLWWIFSSWFQADKTNKI